MGGLNAIAKHNGDAVVKDFIEHVIAGGSPETRVDSIKRDADRFLPPEY